jgi:Uma2 family endonuclease
MELAVDRSPAEVTYRRDVEHPESRDVAYPESDGQPMAETDTHRDEMVDCIEALKERYRDDPSAYVAGNLCLYYEEGEPSSWFSPDVLVVFGIPKKRRRVYKTWVEKRVPAFVLEVTSRKTRLEDKGNKRELCAELGVAEYFLFDPENDYLKPPLQGFRLVNGEYAPIGADAAGRVRSEALGLLLAVEDERLRFVDEATGAPLLRVAEQAAKARREAARAEREAARAEREAARAEREAALAERETARANAAEAELARLRALLEQT